MNKKSPRLYDVYPYEVEYIRGRDWYDSNSPTGWKAISDWCNMQFGPEDWQYRPDGIIRGSFLFTKESDASWFVLRWT